MFAVLQIFLFPINYSISDVNSDSTFTIATLICVLANELCWNYAIDQSGSFQSGNGSVGGCGSRTSLLPLLDRNAVIDLHVKLSTTTF